MDIPPLIETIDRGLAIHGINEAYSLIKPIVPWARPAETPDKWPKPPEINLVLMDKIGGIEDFLKGKPSEQQVAAYIREIKEMLGEVVQGTDTLLQYLTQNRPQESAGVRNILHARLALMGLPEESLLQAIREKIEGGAEIVNEVERYKNYSTFAGSFEKIILDSRRQEPYVGK